MKHISQAFERQANQKPDHIALTFKNTTLNYRDLNSLSNQFAYYLSSNGIKAGDIIGVSLNRSIEMIVCLLGILKAGGSYLPLDPSYPKDRLDYMINDSQVRHIVVHSKENNPFHSNGTLRLLEATPDELVQYSKENFPFEESAQSIAYVLYTSGSTGKPKGVMGTHQGALNRFNWMWKKYPFEDNDVCCQKTTLNFGDSVWEIFGPLLQGIQLILLPDEITKDPNLLVEEINRNKITRIVLVPSLLQSILDYAKPKFETSSLKMITISGEAPTHHLIKQFFQEKHEIKLLNLYGSTEVSADVTYQELTFESLRDSSIPIGYPIDNMQVFILDEHDSEVEVNQKGELFVAGIGLADGYLHKKDLTDKAFKYCQIRGQLTRVYKTGDIGFKSIDGQIFYIGRKDNQIKLRGYRIELTEIEEKLLKIQGIKSAVVLHKKDLSLSRLDAYLQPEEGISKETVSEIYHHLYETLSLQLPDYMIPGKFYFINKIPLTPTGKIDRISLADIDSSCIIKIENNDVFEPRNELEKTLLTICCELLCINTISIYDNLFKMGAHSLLINQYKFLVQNKLGVTVPIKEFYLKNTIASMASFIAVLQHAPDQKVLIQNQEMLHKKIVSSAQKRMYILEKMTGGSGAYNVTMEINLSGYLNVGVLKKTMDFLVGRHASLRTYFKIDTESDLLLQDTHNECIHYFELVDLDKKNYTQFVEEVTSYAFDLSNGPLFKCYLISHSPSDHKLVFSAHHSIIDGYSLELLCAEMQMAYRSLTNNTAIELRKLDVDYTQYSYKQQQWILSDDFQEKLNFWKEYLHHAPETTVPDVCKKTLKKQSYSGETLSFDLSESDFLAIKLLAKENEVSLFTCMMTIFFVLMQRYNNQNDLVIGFPISDRQDQQSEDLVGLFVNTLPMRVVLNSNDTFKKILKTIQDNLVTIYENQSVPFDKIVEVANANRDNDLHPVFQVMFAFEKINNTFSMGDLRGQYNELTNKGAKLDLTLTVQEYDKKITLNFEYSSELYQNESIQRMAQHYQILLSKMINHSNEKINTLSILTEEENRLTQSWGSSVLSEQNYQSIPFLISTQSTVNPEKIAVQCGQQQITFQKLDNKANQLAHYLLQNGVGVDSKILISMDKSIEMIVAIYAVMKTGATFVPVDPKYPQVRIDFIVQNTNPHMILLDSNTENYFQRFSCSLLNVDKFEPLSSDAPLSEVLFTHPASTRAYIIYTSGSTGTPKGVEVTHHTLASAYASWDSIYQLKTIASHLQMASFGFDVFIGDFVRSLCSGAALVLCRYEELLEPKKIYHLLQSQKVECAEFVPAVVRGLMEFVETNHLTLPHLKILICGSDTWTMGEYYKLKQIFGANVRIINSYGLTEAGIDSAYFEDSDFSLVKYWGDNENIPLGTPYSNNNIHILQGEQYVPLEVTGELCISGPALAKGYFQLESLTKERFSSIVLNGERCIVYRTGDLAKYTPSGHIQFLGRNDLQIKLNGNRVDLQEIEQRLKLHPLIQDAKVIVIEIETRKTLAAFCIVDSKDNILEIATIQEYLSESLPAYMVPSALTFLDKFPLTPNGKIDRKALTIAKVDLVHSTLKEDRPNTPKQEILAKVWGELLKRDMHSIHENFFRIGGDSILCISMLTKASKRNLHFSAIDIFKNPTIAGLAQVATLEQREEKLKFKSQITKDTPLIPIQQWFFEKQWDNLNDWCQYIVLDIKDHINLDFLTQSVEFLLKHHDILRSRFSENSGRWSQEILPYQDLASLFIPGENLALDEGVKTLAEAVNIQEGQIFKTMFLKNEGAKNVRLILLAHHLVVDGVSWRILFEDLLEIYTKLSNKEVALLTEKSDSHQQWAQVLQEYSASEQILAEMSYWKEQLRNPGIPLPLCNEPGIKINKTTTKLQAHVNSVTSKKLLHKANLAFQTQINDLLIAALVLAIRPLSSNDMQLSIMLEGHGREAIDPNIDTSRTVGWFTTEFPVSLNIKNSESIEDIIKLVKEQLRAIPNHGIGYGVLKYLSKHAHEFKTSDEPIISFNHLGQWVEDDMQSVVHLSKEGIQLATTQENKSGYLLEIETLFINDHLQIEMNFSKDHFDANLMENLIGHFEKSISEIVAYCTQETHFGYTVSDFPAAKMTQKNLDFYFNHKKRIDDVYPLSPLQKGLLFRHVYQPESDEYMVQTLLEIKGPFDVDCFKQAWQITIADNPILRTGFIWDNVDVPLQYVASHAEIDWQVDRLDNQSLADYLNMDRSKKFDLSQPQLQRFRLIEVSSQEKQLLWSHHHILLDGWSTSSLLYELFSIYNDLRLNIKHHRQDRLSYKDYIQRVNQFDQQAGYQFWRSYLQKVEYPTLLNEYYLKPSRLAAEVDKMSYHLDDAVYASLKQLANEHGLTLNSILLGTWGILLNHYTQQDAIVTGTVVSGRTITDIQKVESTIGLLANSIPLYFNFETDKAVLTFFQQIQEDLAHCNEYSHLSLGDIQKCSALTDKGNLFDTLFVYENFLEKKYHHQDGLSVAELLTHEKSEYPLAVIVNPAQTLEICFTFHSNKFSKLFITQLLQSYMTVLHGFVKKPLANIHQLDLITEHDYLKVIHDWNHTAHAFPENSTLHEQFEQQVQLTPMAIAVEIGDSCLSYEELNRRSNQLAHFLRSLGVETEEKIGIALYRSMDLIIAMLACLKAGTCFIPLDLGYPRERLEFMLNDSNAKYLITDTIGQTHLDSKCSIINLDQAKVELKHQPIGNFNQAYGGSNLAYMIYTSGTTGMPKGVLIEHHSVINLARSQIDFFQIKENSRVLNFAPFSFDASISEVFTALLSGACLILPEKDLVAVGETLEIMLERKEISVVTLPPTVLSTINNLFKLKTLVVAGDKAPKELMDKWCSKVRLINAYGPTENTVCATMQLYNPSQPSNTIGKPISNVTCYVLDKYLKPVAIGVPGYLYLGGSGVARGYYNRPIINSEKFIKNPFVHSHHQLIYSTGDIVRFLPDGELEYIGRLDTQIKIRGFRVELEEIESLIKQKKGVNNAAVIAYGVGAQKSLIAFVVPSDSEFDSQELMRFMSSKLPHFMRPNHIITLEEIPLSPSGKVDRNKLARLADKTSVEMKDIPPQNATEIQLVEIWQELLRSTQINRDDNFFSLGGNSISCIQMISRIKKLLGVNISVSTIFEHPILHELAFQIIQMEKTNLVSRVSTNKQKPIPLSAIQRSMLFLANMDDTNLSYNIPVVFSMTGKLNVVALQTSLQKLIENQEILRTKFSEINHSFYQDIAPKYDFKLDQITCETEEERELQTQLILNKPFNMTHYLMRVSLLQDNKGIENRLVIVFHHAIFDEWSVQLLTQKLSNLYNHLVKELPASLPTLSTQYSDYAYQEQQYSLTDLYKAQLDYWKTALAGAPELLQLPLDYPRPAIKLYQGDVLSFELEAPFVKKLLNISATRNVTLFMSLLTMFNIFLYRYTNDSDIVVGTPITTRSNEEYEALIGCFINTLALRTQVDGSGNFLTHLDQVKATCLAAFKKQEIPFDKVVDALNISRSLSKTALFQVMMVLEDTQEINLQFDDIDTKLLTIHNQTAKTDLTFTFQLLPGCGLQCNIEFSTDLFKKETIARMANHFSTLFNHIMMNTERNIDQIPLVTSNERNVLLNQPILSYSPPASTLHQWFEQQAEKTPFKTAVVYETEYLSYQELNKRANQLAYFLKNKGIEPGAKVALSLERSTQLLVSLIAILKVGGCYVPIDPSSPSDRLLYILEDTQAPLLITHSQFTDKFKEYAGMSIFLDKEERLNTLGTDNLNLSLASSSLAYIIYTSGSTGKPKGVMVTHNNVVRLFLATDDFYGFNANDQWTLFHSYAFDFSVWEIWGALLYGGTLHVIPHFISRSPADFYQYVSTHQITVLNQTPSAFSQLIAHEAQLSKPLPLSLRYVIFGGEALNLNSLIPWFNTHGDQSPKIINMYGITETTVHVTYCHITQSTVLEQKGSIIGHRIPDLKTYILNPCLEPVPVGVYGELYVGGAGVSRGYLNREALTKERFIPDPFSESTDFLYKTGDYARYLMDGSMEYLGRMDEQVKIRGFRIELGEIESILRKNNDIEDVAVIALNRDAQKVLAAYIMPRHGDAIDSKKKFTDKIRLDLAQSIPEYMIPTYFQLVASLPLTINGKLDKKVLCQLPLDSLQGEDYVAPTNETESVFCQVWCEVLQLERVSVQDDFFRLGGNSIISSQIIAKLQQLGYSITIRDLFCHPTIERLCKISAEKKVELLTPKIVSFNSRQAIEMNNYPGMIDIYPLSSMQKIMFHHYGRKNLEVGVYHSQLCYKIATTLFDKEAFLSALKLLVQRHTCFNIGINFALYPGQQFIREKTIFTVDERDLSVMNDADQKLFTRTYMENDKSKPFNVNDEHQPLYRFALFSLDDKTFQFFISLHHAIEDGWGIGEFLKDLFDTYEHLKNGIHCDDQRIANVHKLFIEHEYSCAKSQEHRKFWLNYLQSPPLSSYKIIPLENLSTSSSTMELEIPVHIANAIKKLSLKTAVTLKSVYLAGVMNSLSAVALDQDRIGVVCNGGRRPEIEGSLSSLGLFWNLLPVRINLNKQPLKQLVEIHHHLCEIDIHALYPLSQIEIELGISDLYFTTFNYIQFHNMKELNQDIKILNIDGYDKFHYPLNIAIGVDDINDKVELRVDYNRTYVHDDAVKILVKTLIDNLNELANCFLQQKQGQETFKLFATRASEIDSEALALTESMKPKHSVSQF